MNSATPPTEPTAAQRDEAVLAQQEFGETIDRLIREGFDYRSILAGAAAALARSITASAGSEKVAQWFAQNAALAMHLIDGETHH